ncbi:hypothetical protein AcW1_001649 [Taiwanofungus camphoratus]|nr:hypothetical protein AcW1_001649 [Antrodia cinnamomea]
MPRTSSYPVTFTTDYRYNTAAWTIQSPGRQNLALRALAVVSPLHLAPCTPHPRPTLTHASAGVDIRRAADGRDALFAQDAARAGEPGGPGRLRSRSSEEHAALRLGGGDPAQRGHDMHGLGDRVDGGAVHPVLLDRRLAGGPVSGGEGVRGCGFEMRTTVFSSKFVERLIR